MTEVLWHPKAIEELTLAAQYYEVRTPGLGNEFVSEIERAVELGRKMPHAWVKTTPKSRRIRLRRFPYAVIYQESGDAIHILAVMHLRRAPGYWLERENP